jgi:hypothetical protein
MKKVLTVSLIILALVFGAYPAQAGGKSYGGHGYGYKGHHAYKGYRPGHKARGHGYKHHRGGHRHGHGGHYKKRYDNDDIGDEILIGSAIIGGSILASGLLSQPSYPPPPTYYTPPRPPVCEQTDVYRYLPDGRVQWGVRTRCD